MISRKPILVTSLVAMLLALVICGAYCATMISEGGHSCCPTSQSSNCGMDHSADDKIAGPVPAVGLIKIEETDRIDLSDIISPKFKNNLIVEKITVYSSPGQLIALVAPLSHQFKGSKDFI